MPHNEIPDPAVQVEAKYTEIQVVGEGPEEHEALWIEDTAGLWYCFYLPPNKSFSADIEVEDAT